MATALHALAHLKASEALPAIDAYLQKHPANGQAEAVRARLGVEMQAYAANIRVGRQTLETQVQGYFEGLKLDAPRLNTAVAAYRKAQKPWQGWSREMSVLAELADMAYSVNDPEVVKPPLFHGVNFSKVKLAEIKWRYAAIPKEKRAQMMIDELAHSPALTGDSDGLMQLVIDEGLPASLLVEKKLHEMNTDRNQYKHANFCAMFRILCGIGNKNQVSVIQPYLDDQDGYVAIFACQVYGSIKQGLRKQWCIGY